MKLIKTDLPLLDKAWEPLVKERTDIMPVENPKNTEPPSCYGSEPYPGDGRVYLDYDPKKVMTLNFTEGMYDQIRARQKAELLGRIIDYRHNPARRLFTFKVVPHAR